MTLGEWIPAFIDAYKRDTIRPDSLYTVQLVASKIPWEILAMELDEIRPMHSFWSADTPRYRMKNTI